MCWWTCRLRDVLDSRGFSVDEHLLKRTKLSFMREAEFLSCQEYERMDWESFYQLSVGDGRRVTLRYTDYPADSHVPLFEAESEISRSIRSLSGEEVSYFPGEKIDVLWLTSTVFISSFYFSLYLSDEDYMLVPFHTYGVKITPHGNQSRTIHRLRLCLNCSGPK
jgi:hypothetical protein